MSDGPFTAWLHRGGPQGTKLVLKRVLGPSAVSLTRNEWQLVAQAIAEAESICVREGEQTGRHLSTDLKALIGRRVGA